MTPAEALAAVLPLLGPHIRSLNCRITFADDRVALEAKSFTGLHAASDEDGIVLRGTCDGLLAIWRFAPWRDGGWVTLSLQGDASLGCSAISNLILDYAPPTDDLGAWRARRSCTSPPMAASF